MSLGKKKKNKKRRKHENKFALLAGRKWTSQIKAQATANGVWNEESNEKILRDSQGEN